MLGFGRKKKVAQAEVLSDKEKLDSAQTTLDKELDKEKKRKKKAKENAPNWLAVVVLFVSLGLGVSFWIYGRLGRGPSESAQVVSDTSDGSVPAMEMVTSEDGISRPEPGVVIMSF